MIKETIEFMKLKYLDKLELTCLGLKFLDVVQGGKKIVLNKSMPKFPLRVFLWMNRTNIFKYLMFVTKQEKRVILQRIGVNWLTVNVMWIVGGIFLITVCKNYSLTAKFFTALALEIIMAIIFNKLGRPLAYLHRIILNDNPDEDLTITVKDVLDEVD